MSVTKNGSAGHVQAMIGPSVLNADLADLANQVS